MDIHGSTISASGILNEQVARHVFEILPEGGPLVMIFDRFGNCWPSDTEAFAALEIGEPGLRELCGRIDDGHEPLITQLGEHTVVATQLATERVNCGYVVIALTQQGPETALVNADLIEIVLNQIGLILRLIERQNRLFEQQSYSAGEFAQKLAASV
jgi:hypothetical protein